MKNCYFCSTNAFFCCAEQKKIEHGVQTFAALWREFCCLMARVLLQYKLLTPYGTSFAALWPSANKQSAVQNPGSKFFLGCVCVKVSPRTTCCCQKDLFGLSLFQFVQSSVGSNQSALRRAYGVSKKSLSIHKV